MPDTKLENEKAKGKRKIGALKLRRETLRELDSGELKQAQGGGPVDTRKCYTQFKCTRECR
jgi:hypothetical protein